MLFTLKQIAYFIYQPIYMHPNFFANSRLLDINELGMCPRSLETWELTRSARLVVN